RRVHDRRLERERRPGTAFGDVAAHLLVRDVVRPFGQLGREDAGDRPRGDAGGAGALGVLGAKVADGKRRGDEAAELDQRTAAGDGSAVDVHEATLRPAPASQLRIRCGNVHDRLAAKVATVTSAAATT